MPLRLCSPFHSQTHGHKSQSELQMVPRSANSEEVPQGPSLEVDLPAGRVAKLDEVALRTAPLSKRASIGKRFFTAVLHRPTLWSKRTGTANCLADVWDGLSPWPANRGRIVIRKLNPHGNAESQPLGRLRHHASRPGPPVKPLRSNSISSVWRPPVQDAAVSPSLERGGGFRSVSCTA